MSEEAAGGAVADAKGFLKTPRGKAIAAVGLGVLVYLWWNRSSTAGSATATTDPTTVTTTDRVPPTSGGGGGGTVDGSPADARPQDNQSWLSQCVSLLSNPPYNYDSGTVYNALRLALDGQQLTTAQQKIVSEAISLKGSPPEGMPPTNVSPPATGGGTTPPPAGAGSFQISVSAGQHVSAFTDQINAKLGHNVDWVLMEATNPSLASNINWGPSGSKDLSIRTFKKAATYTVPAGA